MKEKFRIDATYREFDNTIYFYPKSPAAAAWLAKHSTTNVAECIHYTVDRGWEIIKAMREDSLNVSRG